MVAVFALLLALLALYLVRRSSRRLDTLNQQYWDLRYEYTVLRSRVGRLDPDTAVNPEPTQSAGESVSFVPLSAIRKKEK